MLPIHTILYPTDYSDSSRPAFDLACALARDFNAELVICHVAPPPAIAAADGLIIEMPTGEIEQMTARLEQVMPSDPKIRVKHRLQQGSPAAEIVRLAKEVKANMIVIGTHGRGMLGRLLMGSVAEAVMRKAPCPVVSVKSAITIEDEAATPEAATAG